MQYKDTIDFGRSDTSSLNIYYGIYKELTGIVIDNRSDKLIQFNVLMEKLIDIGDLQLVFERLMSNSRRLFYVIRKQKLLIDILCRTEYNIDKELAEMSADNMYFFNQDDDEDEEYLTGEVKPINKLKDYSVVTDLSLIYFEGDRDKIDLIWKFYDEHKFAKKTNGNGVVHLVQTTQHGRLTLNAAKIKTETYGADIIESNYNESFLPAYEKIRKFAKEETGGFCLLSGAPGTGKSSFITHLISIAQEFNRKFVVVPPAFGAAIVEPGFMGFCIEELSGAVLVIEDAENILRSRTDSETNPAVTNILNLTDGILSGILDIKIIATVNVEEQIDKALLRKGRLKVKYYFDLLSADKSNKLLKKLGSDRVVTEPHTLADLYNIAEQVEFDGKTVRKEPMGFRR